MEVINFTSNMYGDLLLDFLINSNICMKNGWKCINNDFTSVSIKGLAVVDYCFVSHDDLHMFNKLIVIRASVLYQDIIQQFGFILSSIPDHSIITCDISADYETRPHTKSPLATYDKFDTQSIPEDFLMSAGCLAQINQIIGELKGSF